MARKEDNRHPLEARRGVIARLNLTTAASAGPSSARPFHRRVSIGPLGPSFHLRS